MIDYTCPCGKEYLLKDEFAGARVECYQCHATGTVDPAKSQAVKALKAEETEPQKLSNPLIIVKRSIRFFEERKMTFVTMGILRGVFDLLPLVPYLALRGPIESLSIHARVGLTLFASFIAFLGYIWHPLAMLSVIGDRDLTLYDSFRLAAKKYIHFLTVVLLIVFVSLGGLLVKYPKIYLALSLNFGLIIFMSEKAHGASTKKTEKKLTAGYRWAIALRIIIAAAIFESFLLIPRTGIAVTYVFYSILPIYIFAIFEELKSIQGEDTSI